ncbi:AbrB/MazE/SpoVT family DNA-binding domain-containing protein [Candidatus Pacearchaeota archaeon]|nr:AbrB/MazE/SpoVT family DNA-binding domain-containing protein [Candidatus Pacearchaeota archaeon]
MQRKIVRHGNSTLTISLPAKWAKVNNLKSGQQLNIETIKDNIIISPKSKYFDSIETDLSENEEWYIGRIIRHLYTSGYDEITIHYSKPNQLALIRKDLGFLTGLEVIESKPNYCKLKCTISVDESEYDTLIKRVLWLILSQFDYFIEDCKNEKTTNHEEVKEIFNTFRKLCNVCRRLINKRHIYDSINSRYAYDFINGLIEISLYIKYSYDYIVKEGKLKLTEDEFNLVQKTREMYYELLIAYQNTNVEKTRVCFESRQAMFDEILNIFKQKNPVIMHYFLIIIRNLTPMGNHILMLNIEKEKTLNKKKQEEKDKEG